MSVAARSPAAPQRSSPIPVSRFQTAERVPAARLRPGGEIDPTLRGGRINAPDAESAVKEWIEKFNITNEEHQQRLVARRVK